MTERDRTPHETRAPTQTSRRPADQWPPWVVLVAWLLWRAAAAPAELVQRGARTTCRRVVPALGRAARRTGEELPRLASRAAEAGRQLLPHLTTVAIAGARLDRWAWATARRGARWSVTAARRDLRGLRTLSVWLGPPAWRATRRRGHAALVAVEMLARATPDAARAVGRSMTRVGRARAARASALAAVVLVVSLWAFTGPALRVGADLVASEVEDEGLPPLDEPSLVIGADGGVLTALPGSPHRDVVPLDEVPEALARMVVAVEDDRFWDHAGWDGEGMLRAAITNVRAGGVEEGGSTISQQLAKQNFAGTDRTVIRKAKELLYAVALEERYDKRELLEYYLNQSYLGSGSYGVAAAAREYFGVAVGELSPGQAALLVGLIRSPGSLDPRKHPEAARERRNVVLRVAAERGIITPDEAEAHRATPLELAQPRAQVTDPMLAEAVRRELLGERALGRTVEQRAELLATGGLRIETTIDPRLQAAAEHAVAQGLSAWPGLGGALAAVDPGTGHVRAIVSMTPPGTEAFDVATQGRRQPGSTFKPLAAMAALEAGLDPDERMAGDGPVSFEHRPGQRWTVDNYGESDHGRVELDEALTSSVNTAFAQLAVATGTERIADLADRLGIDVDAAMGQPEHRGPSVALGALHRGVSPLEMASAYSVFATGGHRVEPTVVARVVDGSGRELLRRKAEPEMVVDAQVVGTVTPMLQEAVEDGTGRAARLDGWRPAGKTGTTQQHADAWFVGAVPGLSTATWLGHPDGSQAVPGLTGGRAAAPMWHAFMAAALDGAPPAPFPELPVATEPLAPPLELPDPQRPPED